MLKQVVLFLCVFVAVSSLRFRKPRTLVDEVVAQLDELRNIVQGEILAAHDSLDYTKTDFTANSQRVSDTGIVGLRQQEQTIVIQITAIKGLANSAGEDITACTSVGEGSLHRIFGDFIMEQSYCIGDIDGKVTQILGDARYIIDVVINKVHDLEFQVNQCNENLLCLSPLLTEIQLNKIRLPQNIGTEVQAADTLVSLEKNSVQTCADMVVAGFTSESYKILADLMVCANAILGKH